MMETTLERTEQNTPSRRRPPPRDQRARRFRRQLLVVCPELDEPRYAPLVASFARLSILGHDAYEFLREKGLVNEYGELRSSVEVVNRLIAGQLKLATALGLSPAVLGKLRKQQPIDLAAALAEHGENAE
jgi:hypothetical protein